MVRSLARYTHRIAISNDRIVGCDAEWVRFRYHDRKDHSRQKTGRLDGPTFSRRFLQHALPKGFVRVRRYGLLSNRVRKEMLERCRQLLGADPPVMTADESRAAALLRIFDKDPERCPYCREGRLVVTANWRAPVTPELVEMICRPLEPP